jgi:hypothetical protein
MRQPVSFSAETTDSATTFTWTDAVFPKKEQQKEDIFYFIPLMRRWATIRKWQAPAAIMSILCDSFRARLPVAATDKKCKNL